MRVFKVFFGLLVLLGLLLVLIQNTDNVTVNLVFKEYQDSPLAVVLIITLAVGIFIGFMIALSSILESKAETRILRGESKKLTSEINSLRNIAVEDDLYDDDDEEE